MQRWNTMKVALWGAALGVLYSAVRTTMEGMFGFDSDHLADILGGLGGGALGGAMLFAAVSTTHNLILKDR
jgi:hypothetical protein